MDPTFSALRKYFPSLPMNILKKIYQVRCERLRALMHKGIPEDVRWLIEAKVRLAGEIPEAFVSHMPGIGRSSYAKKRRAKRLRVCHKCGRWTCNTKCRSLGMISDNREDKIRFIKNGLSKDSLDDIQLTLETHSCGSVQRELLGLWSIFHEERERYSPGNLTVNDPVCQLVRKLDGKQILDS